MHADGKSILASVSKWNSGKVNYNWVVDRRNMPVEDLIRSQLQSEEEVTDQRFCHFKLCIALNFKSL